MARTSRKKKKNLIKAGVLAGVFLAALIGYFVWSFFNTEKEFTVYTSMEEPTLPVVYTSVYGQELNCMHGYLQDMGNEAAADSITPLPQNRRLELRIAEYDNSITSISYEIRSLDLEHFIESTTLDEFSDSFLREDGNLRVTLPIQNLIEKDTQYLLSLHLDTGEQTINYYTRIIWTDNDNANQMVSFARNFAEKTFDYNAARDLTTYLETSDTEDNTDLGNVTIHSSFSQLTWGDTDMQLATDIEVCLKEFDGIMGAVELKYMTTRTNELDSTERYQVVEEYTMRMGAERIYLMDFQRKTNQIFEGSKQLFTGKRILLGITNQDMLQTEKSENGRYIAFTANKELWVYDQDRKHATNIFSFRSGVDDGARANYDQHGIKILSLENNGNMDFVVYGYMNRGRHEGYNGLAYYHYSRSNDTITESFFVPLAKTFDKIALEVSELCQKGDNDMFYLKQNDSIVAIDLRSLEMMDIATGLTDGSYAISRDQTKVAWQDGPIYGSRAIKFMDIMNGSTRTVNAEAGEYLRVQGFMEHDLIYGRAREGDDWILSNCVKGLPMYRLEIINDNMETLMEYQQEGIYISEVQTEGNRIHVSRLQKNASGDPNHAYLELPEDTIVYQNAPEGGSLTNIGTDNSSSRRKIYYVMLDEEIKTTRNLQVSVPRRISYENAGSIELIQQRETEGMVFYSYARGRLAGKTTSFEKAVELCYDGFGWVKDENSVMLYNRTDRESRGQAPGDSQAAEALRLHLPEFTGNTRYEDGWILLNGQGLSLSQVLYYVYQGTPVAAYLEDMRYLLIVGYDNFNVRLYDPEAPEESRESLMGMEDAEAFFTSHQNDFVLAVYAQE